MAGSIDQELATETAEEEYDILAEKQVSIRTTYTLRVSYLPFN